MTFTSPANWAQSTVDGKTLFWLRVHPDTTPTPGSVTRIYLYEVIGSSGNITCQAAQISATAIAGSVDNTEDLEGFRIEAQRASNDGGTSIQRCVSTIIVGKR